MTAVLSASLPCGLHLSNIRLGNLAGLTISEQNAVLKSAGCSRSPELSVGTPNGTSQHAEVTDGHAPTGPPRLREPGHPSHFTAWRVCDQLSEHCGNDRSSEAAKQLLASLVAGVRRVAGRRPPPGQRERRPPCLDRLPSALCTVQAQVVLLLCWLWGAARDHGEQALRTDYPHDGPSVEKSSSSRLGPQTPRGRTPVCQDVRGHARDRLPGAARSSSHAPGDLDTLVRSTARARQDGPLGDPLGGLWRDQGSVRGLGRCSIGQPPGDER